MTKVVSHNITFLVACANLSPLQDNPALQSFKMIPIFCITLVQSDWIEYCCFLYSFLQPAGMVFLAASVAEHFRRKCVAVSGSTRQGDAQTWLSGHTWHARPAGGNYLSVSSWTPLIVSLTCLVLLATTVFCTFWGLWCFAFIIF